MIKKINFLWSLLASFFIVSSAWGNRLELPQNLTSSILSEAVPSAFALEGINAEDFRIRWQNDLPFVESAHIEKDSLQWVRLIDVLVLPRGRAHIQFKRPVTVRASYGGFSSGGQQMTSLQLPVALFNHTDNQVKVEIEFEGKTYQSSFHIRYQPLDSQKSGLVFYDSSCSKYGVNAQWSKKTVSANDWVYIGCRPILTASNHFRKSTLEMYVFWENPEGGQKVRADNLEIKPSLPLIYTPRLNSSPGKIVLSRSEGQELIIDYALSERHTLGFLGLGIGPYFGDFSAEGEYDYGWSPLLTLYGSVFISEGLRFVAFDATSISNRLWTDFGLYLSTENAKMFDQRMTMNLLFGGHFVGFQAEGKVHVAPSFPQGFEFIYTDAFKRGHNMSLGGFIYPEINGRSYYNLWWRWGGRVFGEINYLAAKETINNQSVSSKSLGVTFGFPIARFW
ncbi:MAG: hypothetical protein RJB66_207 [Pseudomonadota bacterium]|jgi:hypothetical protein